MRAVAVVMAVLVLIPNAATAQTAEAPDEASNAGRGERERRRLQVAAGPTLRDGGHVVAAAFGYAPLSWLEVLVNVERTHMPFQRDPFPGGYSLTRGGTMTFASGEVRFSLPRAVSPFAMAGTGFGISHPTVNAEFPERVTNPARVLYAGGGVDVPVGRRFSVSVDARLILTLEGADGLGALAPLRAGVAWRF